MTSELDRVGNRPSGAGASADALDRTSRADWLALAIVVAFFCVPLFAGLGNTDLDNDEAIYSYAVVRMLETGDWLTPRAIPFDGPFLEKPPLKFWMVAAPIALGLLPADEVGLRVVDVLMSCAALLYVFAFGRWHAGAVSGVAAVLVLYTLGPFVFVHGLRSNNMEAALLLSYVGGLYHFARWVEGGGTGRAAWHRWPVALFFTLGFLTKFVAAFFLPVVALLALALRRDGVRLLLSRWTAWLAPAAIVLALSAPWFVYHTLHSGRHLWLVMFGQHVYQRFTTGLDAGHLQPWHYYLSTLWLHLQVSGSGWITLAGGIALGVAAWRRDGWLSRLFLVWAIVPIALVSFGSSKIFHYIYPFLPPVALGAGYAASLVFRGAVQLASRAAMSLRRVAPWLDSSSRRVPRAVSWGLVVLAGIAAIVGLATAAAGGLDWKLEGVAVRNTSLVRPFVIAGVLFWAAGQVRPAARSLATALLVLVLPVAAYPATLEHARKVRRPLQAASRCLDEIRRSSPAAGHKVYNAAVRLTTHSYNYYLRAFEPWVRTNHMDIAAARGRLLEEGAQAPVIVSQPDYARVVESVAPADADRLPVGFSAHGGLYVILPGPYEPCAAEAVSAGATPVGFHTSRARGR